MSARSQANPWWGERKPYGIAEQLREREERAVLVLDFAMQRQSAELALRALTDLFHHRLDHAVKPQVAAG